MSANLSPLDPARSIEQENGAILALLADYYHTVRAREKGHSAENDFQQARKSEAFVLRYLDACNEINRLSALVPLDPSPKGGMEQKEILDGSGKPLTDAARLRIALCACEAALKYDRALSACANNPAKMSSYCTAEGDSLDALYFDWVEKSKSALEAQLADASEAEPDCKRCGDTGSIGHSQGYDGEAYEIDCPECHPDTPEADQSPSSPVARECWVRWTESGRPIDAIQDLVCGPMYLDPGEWVRMVEAPALPTDAGKGN